MEQTEFVSGIADVADDGKAPAFFELFVDLARIAGAYPQVPSAECRPVTPPIVGAAAAVWLQPDLIC
jgi:hypothetical protein